MGGKGTSNNLRRRSRPGPVLVVVALSLPPPAGARTAPCTAAPEVVYQGYPLPSGTGETSGLVASSRHPGWAWAVRDSGHPPNLYAVRFRGRRGHVVRAVRVAGADNTDWEDVAYARNRDGTGRLYAVESGQSGRDRFIYKIPEPHPEAGPGRVGQRRYRYAFPGDRHFNVEAVFFHHSRLVLVTKTAPARVYRFEERLSERRINRPRFLGVLQGSPQVSAARVSPDGHTLVVANHGWIYAYQADGPDAELSGFLGRRPAWRKQVAAGDNIEAGDFLPVGSCNLVLVAESKNVYRALTHAVGRP